ncbi:MAG TPA: penicillin-binding protein, partial [Telluria sp.]
YMRVALAKRPVGDQPIQPDGIVRENDDWVYAEFAETPALGAIDLDQQQPDPNAPPGTVPPAPGQPGTVAPAAVQQAPANSLF